MKDVVDIYRYPAASPADAFEAASRDASHWNFNEMLALAEMAQRLRNGYPLKNQRSTTKRCICNSGFFLLFEDKPQKGYGIACVTLTGHESGVADDAAQEILDFHREREGEGIFAESLLTWSEHITTLADLDQGYELLIRASFVKQVDGCVVVTDEARRKVKRPKFMLRTGIVWPQEAKDV